MKKKEKWQEKEFVGTKRKVKVKERNNISIQAQFAHPKRILISE